MATKKKAIPKVVATLEIICKSDETCDLKFKGDMQDMTAGIASLLILNDRENHFRDMITIAVDVASEAEKKIKNTVTKKKAATKKKK